MKSKAYCFSNAADYDIDDISEEITFAETPGKAKQDFSMETGIHYKDIRVQLISYVCGECGEKFLDRDDNYKFCPYCGRKIVNSKE